ncbi:MAG TPA: YdjY domain-containing protein [Pirellulaceae bacterium]|jgi:hypothetical protein|nr:YdjY domain-containing protein [Pirellulaceae bacterium]
MFASRRPLTLVPYAAALLAFALLLGGPFACSAFAQEDDLAAPALVEQAEAPEAAATPDPSAMPEATDAPESTEAPKATGSPEPAKGDAAPETGGLIALNRQGTVKIDRKRKLVVVDGRIALRAGQLEMFACPAGTKEHESVVALLSDSKTIHAGLLAVGARPGAVVKWDPEYAPAFGDVIEIYVLWKDAEGKPHQVRGQSWVRDVKTGEEMKTEWIFAGSGFWTDPGDGIEYYYADGGEAICVSNFPTAMIDLPIQSSQANDSLLFEAFESRIPPRNTPVRVVLRPVPNSAAPKRVEPGAADPAAPQPPAPAETQDEAPADSPAEPAISESEPAPPAERPPAERPEAEAPEAESPQP